MKYMPNNTDVLDLPDEANNIQPVENGTAAWYQDKKGQSHIARVPGTEPVPMQATKQALSHDGTRRYKNRAINIDIIPGPMYGKPQQAKR